jgi:hypothetical protein
VARSGPGREIFRWLWRMLYDVWGWWRWRWRLAYAWDGNPVAYVRVLWCNCQPDKVSVNQSSF